MYEPQNFNHLLGLPGFSDELLNNHFSLYQGYVKNATKLWKEMDELWDEMDSPKYAELKRRLGWEFNGMRLHEYYFGNLTKELSGISEDSDLYKKISNDYESFKNWEEDFRATVGMRGIGWAILYYDPIHNCVMNMWINEHDAGHPAGCAPLLVMDVFEHAYMTDYGTKKADYIDSFFKAIDWKAVEERFRKIVK